MTVATATFAMELAVLGVLSDGPDRPEAVAGHVQAVCRPWLAPTRCVVHDRLVAALENGWLSLDADGRLRLTEAGRARLRGLLTTSLEGAGHGLLPLVETLKLALADQLDAAGRRRLLDELVELRARCLGAQAAPAEEGPALVRRCRERRRRAAALAHRALARELLGHDATAALVART
jgi:hypothetical protein